MWAGSVGLNRHHLPGQQRRKLAVAQDAARGFNEAGGSLRACVSRRVCRLTGSPSKAMLRATRSGTVSQRRRALSCGGSFRQAFFHSRAAQERLTHPHPGAHHIDAHGYGARAVQEGGGHERAVAAHNRYAAGRWSRVSEEDLRFSFSVSATPQVRPSSGAAMPAEPPAPANPTPWIGAGVAAAGGRPPHDEAQFFSTL